MLLERLLLEGDTDEVKTDAEAVAASLLIVLMLLLLLLFVVLVLALLKLLLFIISDAVATAVEIETREVKLESETMLLNDVEVDAGVCSLRDLDLVRIGDLAACQRLEEDRLSDDADADAVPPI